MWSQMHKYAPNGKDTSWCIAGAVYVLIQAGLKYFGRSSEVLREADPHLRRCCLWRIHGATQYPLPQ
jgi:hypothetical protein